MNRLEHAHLPHVYLKPGELFLSRQPALVTTVLGSCVSVTIFSPTCRTGAICHALLPKGGLDEGFRYVDSTIDYMVGKFTGMGIGLSGCEVKLFGGADILLTREARGVRLSVGRQNILEAGSRLQHHGITLVVSEVGGDHGRKLFFNSQTGDVFLKKVRKTVY
jgi:chemotaxis protein CheD